MAQRKIMQLQQLCGADLSHSASDVELTRSPDCPNMMRSVPGKVRKRMGITPLAHITAESTEDIALVIRKLFMRAAVCTSME